LGGVARVSLVIIQSALESVRSDFNVRVGTRQTIGKASLKLAVITDLIQLTNRQGFDKFNAVGIESSITPL